MAYVPGFQNDLFISYAHADDQARIESFSTDLKRQIASLLGTEPVIWRDPKLRSSQQFDPEILQSVRDSALLLILTSPSYLKSPYCVGIECQAYSETLPAKKKRFQSNDLRNEHFVFRVPMVPTPGNQHYDLFPGVSDAAFDDILALSQKIHAVLAAMRAVCDPVFLNAPHTSIETQPYLDKVSTELHKHFYAIEPFFQVGQERSFEKSITSIHLIGPNYSPASGQWIKRALKDSKPWIAWCSREIQQQADPPQKALLYDIKKDPHVVFLESASPVALWADISQRVHLDRNRTLQTSGKKSVCMLHDPVDDVHAGRVQLHYDDFHYRSPSPGDRLIESDGVLLVWGEAGQGWAPEALDKLLKARAGSKGLCVFDPPEDKQALLDELQKKRRKLHIIRQFGGFDPARLDPFFAPLRNQP